MHGISVVVGKSTAIEEMHAYLIGDEPSKLKSFRLVTGGNRASVMSKEPYHAYCRPFGLRPAIQTTGGRASRGIGRRKTSIGSSTIQFAFNYLQLMIDVEFLLLDDQVPTLLSMRDMIRNGLEISMQQAHSTHMTKKQRIKLDNYFFFHEWYPHDICFALYMENQIRRSIGT